VEGANVKATKKARGSDNEGAIEGVNSGERKERKTEAVIVILGIRCVLTLSVLGRELLVARTEDILFEEVNSTIVI